MSTLSSRMLDEASNLQRERFSLLQLDPGEIYFKDFGAYFYPPDLSEAETIQKKQRGRLKICSKSIAFEPTEHQFPILKFPFKDCTNVGPRYGQLFSKIGNRSELVLVECRDVITMKELNIIAPYKFSRFLEPKSFLFELMYQKSSECLDLAMQLYRAATSKLEIDEQQAMIGMIAQSMFKQAEYSFDPNWLDDHRERTIIEKEAERVTPLVTNPGRIRLTDQKLYFQPFNKYPVEVFKIKLKDIRSVLQKRFLLRQVALEVTSDNVHLLIVFPDTTSRDAVHSALVETLGPGWRAATDQDAVTLRWQHGLLSNFDYLMFINGLGDRSFNDLTQYPVFPWVVADYESSTLDLTDDKTFRDLSKPIGALNEARLKRLQERYAEMPDSPVPRFLYGSHYSTPGFVLYYLVRVVPEYMLCLQNGKFDQPDRMFTSLPETWKNVIEGQTDFKELIPEFYDGDGRFLENPPGLELGRKQDGTPVGPVALPPWATSPLHLVRQLRRALESEYVSRHLHHWIDLIFGYKQRGEEAVAANNVFYYLTYEGAVQLEQERDYSKRQSIETQINEFGQTPKQIFNRPHPQRLVLQTTNAKLQRNFSSKEANEQQGTELEATGENGSAEESSGAYCDSQIEKLVTFPPKSLQILRTWCHHKQGVTGVAMSEDGNTIYSVGNDNFLKVFNVPSNGTQRAVSFSNLPLTSLCVLPSDPSTAASDAPAQYVLVGSADMRLYLYNVEFGRTERTFHIHHDVVSAIKYVRRGPRQGGDQLVFTGSFDSTVKKFSLPRGVADPASLAECGAVEHEFPVTCLDVAEHGAGGRLLLAVGDMEGHLALWDEELTLDSRLYEERVHSGEVVSLAFNPSGTQLLVAGQDGGLCMLDVDTLTIVLSVNIGTSISVMSWPGGSWCICGTQTAGLEVWYLPEREKSEHVDTHNSEITAMVLNIGLKLCLTADKDNNLSLWTLKF